MWSKTTEAPAAQLHSSLKMRTVVCSRLVPNDLLYCFSRKHHLESVIKICYCYINRGEMNNTLF